MATGPEIVILESPADLSAVGRPAFWKAQRAGTSSPDDSIACELTVNGVVVGTLSQNIVAGLDEYDFYVEYVVEPYVTPEKGAGMFFGTEFFYSPEAIGRAEARFYHFRNSDLVQSSLDVFTNEVKFYRAYPLRWEAFDISGKRILTALPFLGRQTLRNGREFITVKAGAVDATTDIDYLIRFTDGTSLAFSYTYANGSIDIDNLRTIEISEDKLRQYFSSPKIMAGFDLTWEGFTLSYEIVEEGTQVFYTNRLGGIDSHTFVGDQSEMSGVEGEVYEDYFQNKTSYGIKGQHSFGLWSRYLTQDEILGLRDLVYARKIWLLKNGMMLPAVIDKAAEAKIETNSNLRALQIKLAV